MLAEVLSHFKPFYKIIMRLQSRIKKTHYKTIWKGFPCIKFLLNKVISAKQNYAARMAVKIAIFNKNDEGA
jgi:hypothetical protein